MKFIKEMIISSHDQRITPSKLGYKRYLLNNNRVESSFEIGFIVEKTIYQYAFTINAEKDEVVAESLMRYDSQKPTNLYSRTGKEIKASARFDEAGQRQQFIRPNGLALSIFSNT
jgi:hypothetical protein